MPTGDATITSRDMCNQAVVERILSDASVSSVKIAANLESDNYDGGVVASDPGSAGWRVERNTGDAVFNNLVLRGSFLQLPSGTSFPGAPEDGELFYRTDSNKAYRYDGTSWHAIDALDDANRVGTSVIATAAIQNAAITNAKINDLSADKIDAGTLNADRIGAGSLTVGKLIVSSWDNLIEDPGFESGALHPKATSAGGGGTWTWSSSAPRSGGGLLAFLTSGQSSTATFRQMGISMADNPQATEGDIIYFSAFARSSSVARKIRLDIDWFDENGSLISTSSPGFSTLTTSFAKYEAEGTAPAGTAYAAFRIRIDTTGGAVAHTIRIDDLYARRKIGTLIIEDQAVDIARMLDPVHNDRSSDTGSNVSLSTTRTTTTSTTSTIPSWVGTAYFTVTHAGHINGEADTMTISYERSGGTDGVAGLDTTGNSSAREAVTTADTLSLAAPGSSVTLNGRAVLDNGTNSSNLFHLAVFVSGVR